MKIKRQTCCRWIVPVLAGGIFFTPSLFLIAKEKRAGNGSSGKGGKDGGAPVWVSPASRQLPPGTSYKTFHSKEVGGEVSYFVYLPPSYNRESTRRYPILYWLHGSGGNAEKGTDFIEVLHDAIGKGKAPEMIVVLLNGLKVSMWVDHTNGKQPVESYVTRDMIPYIDQEYRTIGAREGRWIEGFSMGGYGAAHYAFKHPELFGAVTEMAGALLDWEAFEGMGVHEIFGTRERFEAESPFSLAEKNLQAIKGNMLVRVIIGDKDNGKQNLLSARDLMGSVPYDLFDVVRRGTSSPNLQIGFSKLTQGANGQATFQIRCITRWGGS